MATDVQQQLPNVHWVWGGLISSVYEAHPRIVVKVPKSDKYGKAQFQKEIDEPCPYVVQCFHYTENGIFLEYMRDTCLSYRIQENHTRDRQTMVVTKVDKREPLALRKQWMNELAQAVAFLESLGLAHGDLRPENVLLDRDRLKLSDFDSTAKIGAEYKACVPLYSRMLNKNELNQGESGTPGFLGPRTELFALGSVFYLINYGFEVYGDRCMTDDPYDHGPTAEELLQEMKFPLLDGHKSIDRIIDKCWHGNYLTVAELAKDTERLLHANTEETWVQRQHSYSASW